MKAQAADRRRLTRRRLLALADAVTSRHARWNPCSTTLHAAGCINLLIHFDITRRRCRSLRPLAHPTDVVWRSRGISSLAEHCARHARARTVRGHDGSAPATAAEQPRRALRPIPWLERASRPRSGRVFLLADLFKNTSEIKGSGRRRSCSTARSRPFDRGIEHTFFRAQPRTLGGDAAAIVLVSVRNERSPLLPSHGGTGCA